MTTATAADPQKLEQFVGQFVTDMGAAFSGSLIIVGDRLGLYSALAEQGPLDSEGLAGATGTDERYVREWLAAQASAGYIQYDPAAGRYSMTPEQAAVLADQDSPHFLVGGFDLAASMYRDEPKITDAFKTGAGIPWGDHDGCLFCGTERFFRAGYTAHLVNEWLPALDGVKAKLEKGCRVADIGCGNGASTIIMAKAFPNSTFVGYDIHEPSIETARHHAADAGLNGNVSFDTASAKMLPEKGYDLVCCFDCLHDMGDPVGAAKHIRESMAPDGTWMIVEPFAHDEVHDNLNLVGRLYYSASTMICVPGSRSQEVGACLGAQAGEKRLRDVCEQGGFTSFRRATETPFNLILEARP